MQPVLAMLDSLDNAQYCAPDFHLMMAGDWVLMVQARCRVVAVMERMFAVQGVSE